MKKLALAGLVAILPGLSPAAPAAPAPQAPPAGEAPAPRDGESPAPDAKKKDPRREWIEKLQQRLRKNDGAPPAPGAPRGEEDEEENRADPIKTLEQAAKLMTEAEEYLYAAAARKGMEKGTDAEKRLTPPVRPPDKQPDAGTTPPQATPPDAPPPAPGEGGKAQEKMKLAQEKIDKLLGGADQRQKDTIELINLLIRQARQVEQQSQQQQQQRQQEQQQRQQQQPQNTQPNATNPAQRPYTPPPAREGTAPPRTADRADRWGDLPPHMRDETNQGMRQVEEFPSEYRELLQEYYKRLSGADQ
jgi:hypothetical protein